MPKFIYKQFFSEIFRPKFCGISKNFGYKLNATSESYSIPPRSLGRDTRNFRPKKCGKVTLALVKDLVLNRSGRKLAGERTLSTNSSGPVYYDLANADKQYANGSYKNVYREIASKLWNAVGNAECQFCFEENSHFPLFLTETCWKNILAIISQNVANLNVVSSISAKILAFASWL